MTEAARLSVAVGADITDLTKKLGAAASSATTQMATIGRAAGGAVGGLRSLDDVVGNLDHQLAALDQQARIFGDAFSGAAKKADVVRGAIVKLTEAGAHADSAGMKPLIAALDQFEGEAKQAERAAGGLGGAFKSNLAANLAADAIQAAGRAMVDVGAKSLRLAGEFEQSTIAFTTMLGSATKADKFLRELASFAASTPFELRGLTDSSKKLLAFGFEARAVIPIMTGVGNAVAGVGGGKDTLDGVTLALGQIAAKGKVSAEELGQLGDRGIPAVGMLAKAFGKSTGEIQKMVSDGLVPADKAILALVNGMNEKFPNMMAKQSKSFDGAMSNLVDATDGAMRRIGERIIETFNLTDIISTASGVIQGFIKTLDDGKLDGILTGIKAGFLGIGAAITVAVAPAITATLIPAIHRLALAWAPAVAAALPYIALAGAVAFAAIPIMNQWDDLKLTLLDIWGAVADGAAKMWNQVRNHWNTMAEGARNLGGIIMDYLRPIADFLKPYWDKLPEQFRVMLGEVGRTAYHLPEEIATNLAAGNGPVLGAAKTLGRELADNLAYSWGGVGDSINAVMDNVTKAIAGGTAQTSKLTLDMLKNLGGAVAKTGDGAKKAAAAAKKAADEAAKAIKAHDEALGRGEKAIASFSKKLDVFADLGRAMRETDEKARELGGRFDDNAERAGILKAAIARLKQSGFADTSPVVRTLTRRMEELHDASDRVTKPLAAAYKVLDDSAEKYEAARLKAGLLGEAFDGTKTRVDLAREAITKLIDDGLRSGHPVLDEAKRRLDEAGEAAAQAAPKVGALEAKAKDATGELGTLGSSVKTLGDGLGIPFLGPVAEAAGFISNMGGAAGNAIGALGALGGHLSQTVIPAIASFGAALFATPTGWIIAGIAGVAAAIALLQGSFDKTTKAVKDLGTATKRLDIRALTTGARQLTEAEEKVARATRGITDAILAADKALADMKIKTLDSLASGVDAAVKNAAKAFIDATLGPGGIAGSLREGIRDAIINGILDAAIQGAVFKGTFGDLLTELTNKVSSGGDVSGVISKIGAKIPDVAKRIESVMTPIKAAIDSSFTSKINADHQAAEQTRGLAEIMKAREAAIDQAMFEQKVTGEGSTIKITEARIKATEDALRALHESGLDSANLKGVGYMDQLKGELAKFQGELGALTKADADRTKTLEIIGKRTEAIRLAEFQRDTFDPNNATLLAEAKVKATEDALTELYKAGFRGSETFDRMRKDLEKFGGELTSAQTAAAAYDETMKAQTATLADIDKRISETYRQVGSRLDQGDKAGADKLLGQIAELQNDRRKTIDPDWWRDAPALAAGGLVTGPTMAMVGEGRHQEAVIPLSPNVLAGIGRGIAEYGPSGGGATIVVNVNYTGNGKWTPQDARDIGGLLVGELRRQGLGR